MTKNIHKTLYFCALSLLLINNTLLSNDIVFDKIDNRQGLSSDQINKIYQDSEGYIWIATSDGLNCFSGTDFTVYKHEKSTPNSLSSSHTRGVCSAPDGKLWIGTKDRGINILNPSSGEIQRITTSDRKYGLLDNHINNIICDSKGRMWICSVSGISCFDTKTDQALEIKKSKEKIGSVVYEDTKGNILAGSWSNSIYMFRDSTNTFEVLTEGENKMIKGAIKSLIEDSNGNLWIGTWGRGLYKAKYSQTELTRVAHTNVANDNYSANHTFNIVYSIIQDKYDNIWLGTDVGLGTIDNTESNNVEIEWITPSKEKNKFGAKDASNLFVDASNTLWIGTQGNGISRVDFNQSNFKTYISSADSKSYSSDIFRSFWYLNDDLYVGINALGFGKYDIEKEAFTPYSQIPLFKGLAKSKFDINVITSCTPLDKDKLWITTRYKGVIIYNLRTSRAQQIYLPLLYDENSCYLIEEDKVWIGTSTGLMVCIPDSSRNGLFPYSRAIYQHIPNDVNSINSNNISQILRDRDGQIWVSFYGGGIDKVIEDPMKPSKVYFSRGINEDSEYQPDINLMHEDSRGNMWLGTEGDGLWLFQKKKNNIVNFSTATAIRGNSVYGILEDNKHRLWLSTNLGISSINILNLGNPYVINYTVEDGLQGNIFIKNSAFKDKDGHLFFGGYHGFNYFDPDKIKHNSFIPPLVFTNIEVDREKKPVNYREGEYLKLNHKNNSFQINFAALSYTKSSNNQYRYKLEGYDKEWIKTSKGLNKAIYGKLPAGDYRFSVIGSNNNGIWNNTPLTLQIEIKKSPFKTYLAYFLYFIISSLTLGLFFYYTKRQFTLKQAYKDEQNERLRADKINQFKLKFFTNISHELLTPLSIISNAIELYLDKKPKESSELAIVQRNANRLSRLINQLLDFRKVEGDSRKLMIEESDFNHIISSLTDNFLPLCERKGITFSVNGFISQHLFIDIDKIDKMLHNILSNAFKHTPDNGEITLDFNTYLDGDNEYLKMTISDNGKGIPEDQLKHIFDRFYRIDDRKHESGAGIGLAFTKSLVALHKGKIEAKNNTTGGACFIIDLPVSQWNYNEDEITIEKRPDQEVEYSFAEEMDDIKVPIRMVREANQDLPKILLVEDNVDMRSIMRNYLSKYFEIYEGNNGVEGLEALNKVDIELIISDIMMPEMDGLTFCRKVKTNITTSHIPVILTTAKRTQENFIEGYEAQADSYITKPVNLQLLLVRIINLLNQREKLREAFSSEKKPNTKELGINNLDQQLFEKLDEYIETNINNSNLSIGMLSEHVSISSSVFYRKLKSFTSMSPNEYLRSKRLNKAAQMLKDGFNASSVAYECGFSDPSYFGVCFKKQFGVPPKKFVESL